MVGKAEINLSDIDITKKLVMDAKLNNNMRRQRRTGQSSTVAPPRLSGGSSGGGETSQRNKTPVVVNVTDINEFDVPTEVYDKIIFNDAENIIIDDPLTEPIDQINIRTILPRNVPFGCEIKAKPRFARIVVLREGDNIVIPNNNSEFIMQDDFWVTLKYYENAFGINSPGWVISNVTFTPDIEIQFGIFPIDDEIEVDFGAAYIDPPTVTLGYQSNQQGIVPIRNIQMVSEMVVSDGFFTGLKIHVYGNLPNNRTGHFISVNAVARLA